MHFAPHTGQRKKKRRVYFDGAGLYTGLRGVSLTTQVTLENLAFSNHKNYSATSGGAVFARHIGGIKNSRFTDNQSMRAGATVSSSDFIDNMTDVEFSGNVVDSTGETGLTGAHGGALRVQNFTGDIVDSKTTPAVMTGQSRCWPQKATCTPRSRPLAGA